MLIFSLNKQVNVPKEQDDVQDKNREEVLILYYRIHKNSRRDHSNNSPNAVVDIVNFVCACVVRIAYDVGVVRLSEQVRHNQEVELFYSESVDQRHIEFVPVASNFCNSTEPGVFVSCSYLAYCWVWVISLAVASEPACRFIDVEADINDVVFGLSHLDANVRGVVKKEEVGEHG